MRRALPLIATLLSGIAAAACSSSTSNCPPPYDYSLSVATSSLTQTMGSSNPPPCSKCGGPSESPSYECQSTCANAGAGSDAGGSGTAATCIVDSCASSVLAKNVQCNAACGALFPGKTVSGCTMASGTITCSLHETNTCR
jgi:hypothetical protein